MVGWHHRLNGHGFGWTPGVADGQGGLACCSSWGRKESDTTERLNGTELEGIWLGKVWQAQAAPDVIVPGLSSISSGPCFASLAEGVGGGLSSAQTLARPVFLPGDHATSVHLEGLSRGRVNGRLSSLREWVFHGGKGHLCPQFRQQVSSQQRYTKVITPS